MIEITTEQVERVATLLGGIPGGMQKAMYGAINRALITVRAKSATEISRAYKISSSAVKAAGKMDLKFASASKLTGSIKYAGTVLPLISFSVGYGKSGMVTASVMRKGAGAALKHAYVTNLKYGTKVYERETKQRESSKQLFGPSIAHMAEHADVLAKIEEAGQSTMNKRIEHEISRILAGYGGRS